tara:strand:- start:6 stop:497 length:492 start_codon:yes stop_codon:yes gene_type:complete
LKLCFDNHTILKTTTQAKHKTLLKMGITANAQEQLHLLGVPRLPTPSIFAGLPNHLIMDIVKIEGDRVKVDTKTWYAGRKPSKSVALKMFDVLGDIYLHVAASRILKETINDPEMLQDFQEMYNSNVTGAENMLVTVSDIIGELKRFVRQRPAHVVYNDGFSL